MMAVQVCVILCRELSDLMSWFWGIGYPARLLVLTTAAVIDELLDF